MPNRHAGWVMSMAILVLSVVFSLLPWRGAPHLDGPPAADDDPSDYTYQDELSAPHGTDSPDAPASTDAPKEG